ncbi:MFS transporter [Halostella sp. PRR32]|uniref:MFS transporter n=1 Tax=Halostella sp. PRR32 TaxID=3098147 RepID=UPI002B1DD5D8|nr:MFS transporter [Halostella sp. PRR32]
MVTDRSLVFRYYAFRAASSVGFITPVFTLFMLSRGLSFSEIATLSAIVAVVVTAGEIPTGYVGDRVGRRNSLVVSTALLVASLVGFVWANTYPAFVVLYVLWALGLTFASGSDSAWLYDALRARGAEDRFTRIRGRGESVRRAASVVTMIAGGLLYVVSPAVPFIAAAALNVVGIPVLLSLPKNEGYADGTADRLSVREAASVVRTALTRPELRSFVLYVGIFFGAVSASNTYVQPITVDVLEANVAALGVPEEATIGVLYAAFTGVSGVASYHAATVESRLGLRTAVVGVTVGVAVLLAVPLAVPLLAVPTFLAMRAGDAMLRPVANRYLNDRIEGAGRATVLSAASMAYALIRVPLILAGGVVADAAGPLVAVAGFGGTFLVGAATMSFVVASVFGDTHGTGDVDRS